MGMSIQVALLFSCAALIASTSRCKADRSARIMSAAAPLSLRSVSLATIEDDCDVTDPRLPLSILVRKYSPPVLAIVGDKTGTSMLFREDARCRGGGGGGGGGCAGERLLSILWMEAEEDLNACRIEDERVGGGGGAPADRMLLLSIEFDRERSWLGDASGWELDVLRIDPGRREGGGGGALLLDDCGLLPRSFVFAKLEPSSSNLGDSLPVSFLKSLEAATS